jgi:hypothetical protein
MPSFERIIPVLTYQDIPAAPDFLVNAFGFNGGGVHRDAEGPQSMARFVRVTPRFGFTA